MNCIKCGKRIPPERLALVTTDRCVNCSDLYTSKGDVHFWFLGQSNGYYGEDIRFYKQ